MRRIRIFDSTLRDGEQSPGCSMSIKEKVEMAKQLELLKADVIEAGFAIVSPGDFAGVSAIAKEMKHTTVASLARAVQSDIDYAYQAVKCAKYPLIHVFLATSDIHLQYKLKKTREEVLEQAKAAVRYAKSLCGRVEFSAEDATRSDRAYLAEVFRAVVACGADVINVPDTVGYASPEEMADLIRYIRAHVDLAGRVGLSVHCHNDLGLAVANSLAAIKAGADQVECTVNGIGERAGNAALEEIVMNLKTRKDFYQADCEIDTTQITRSSRLLVMLTGTKVQPNKAIVGENAFAHEAGIHQHGILQNRATYEIISPESIGLTANKMILGKHSGRHALEEKLKMLGYHAEEEQLNTLFERFKELADRKKTVSEKDLEALIRNTLLKIPHVYELDKYVINSSNVLNSTCNIRLKKDDGSRIDGFAMGSGPIEAAFQAINDATKAGVVLEEYTIEAVTGGTHAQGPVSVRISSEGQAYNGYGVDMNIFAASILSYINAIYNMLYEKRAATRNNT